MTPQSKFPIVAASDSRLFDSSTLRKFTYEGCTYTGYPLPANVGFNLLGVSVYALPTASLVALELASVTHLVYRSEDGEFSEEVVDIPFTCPVDGNFHDRVAESDSFKVAINVETCSCTSWSEAPNLIGFRIDATRVSTDNSAFCRSSMPLPKDHWLYAPRTEEWDNVRDESADAPRPILTHALRYQGVNNVREGNGFRPRRNGAACRDGIVRAVR